MYTSKSLVTASFFGVLYCAPISAQTTQRVSVDSAGVPGNFPSGGDGLGAGRSIFISPDGRYVAFESVATNLVPGDTNVRRDVFVHDRQTGTTERVSVASGGTEGSDESFFPTMSADGRFVAFMSNAANLVPGDTNGREDVFVRDRQSGTTERVSVATGGAEGNGNSYSSTSISADGRYVVFSSMASNLVPGDTNFNSDVFLRDRQLGTTARLSVTSGGAQVNAGGVAASISADGRYVAFSSSAPNLVPGDVNTSGDIFVRDLQTGTVELVSVDSGEVQGVNTSSDPSISADGRYVAFYSNASNLVPGDTNNAIDVFVRDRLAGTTARMSVDTAGVEGNGASDWHNISADGRYVAFTSLATNLVPGDTNGDWDIFLRDRQNHTTERVSLTNGGAQGSQSSGEFSYPSISSDGRFVAFDSSALLVAGDTSNQDVYVRDRNVAGFPSLCDPGADGVLACPCSNPASGSGRGCDNSAATGGASLSATGVAYFSTESLVFTTNGEKPTALSILLQGNAVLPNGLTYGQGVRCAGGSLKRLFVKTAVAGSITAPDFGAGDPTVSARSAAKGDVIQPGQTRWYLVYYRDPTVLGGCPAGSTFNATQTGQVSWWP